MIFADIENGLVKNTFIADQEFVNDHYPNAVEITDMNPRPSFGWIYEDGKFIEPVKLENDEPEVI